MAVIKAFKNLIKHPIVLLPDLLLAIFILVLARFTLIWTGVDGLLTTNLTEDLLREFFQENLFQVLWPLVVFFFTTFVIGVGEKVIKLELISNVVRHKKASLGYALKHKFHFFFRVISMKVLIFLILALGFVAIFWVIGYLVFLIINPFDYLLANQVSTVITILLAACGLILLKLGFLFRYPIMFMTKTLNPYKVLRESVKKFNKNRKFTFQVWLMTIIVAILFGILTFLLSIVPWGVISYLIIIIGVIHHTWLDMFIFLKFKEKFSKSLSQRKLP